MLRGNKTLPFKETMAGKSSDRNQVSAWMPGSHPGKTDGQEEAKDREVATQETPQKSSSTRVKGFPPSWSLGDRPASTVTGPGGINSKPLPGTLHLPQGHWAPTPPHNDALDGPDVRDGGHIVL